MTNPNQCSNKLKQVHNFHERTLKFCKLQIPEPKTSRAKFTKIAMKETLQKANKPILSDYK